MNETEEQSSCLLYYYTFLLLLLYTLIVRNLQYSATSIGLRLERNVHDKLVRSTLLAILLCKLSIIRVGTFPKNHTFTITARLLENLVSMQFSKNIFAVSRASKQRYVRLLNFDLFLCRFNSLTGSAAALCTCRLATIYKLSIHSSLSLRREEQKQLKRKLRVTLSLKVETASTATKIVLGRCAFFKLHSQEH